MKTKNKVKKIIFYSFFESIVLCLLLMNSVLSCTKCPAPEWCKDGTLYRCVQCGPNCECPTPDGSGTYWTCCKHDVPECDPTCIGVDEFGEEVGPCCHVCTPVSCCIPRSCPGGTASLNFAQGEENKNDIANIFSPPSQIVFRPKSAETINVSPNPNTAKNSWNDLLIQLKEIINKIISPWRQLGMVR